MPVGSTCEQAPAPPTGCREQVEEVSGAGPGLGLGLAFAAPAVLGVAE